MLDPRGRGLHRAPRRCRRPGRTTSSYYTDALAANGIGYDVYDIDARGRKAPDRPRRALATTTPSSGTRATTSSPASPAGPAATRRGWRWTRLLNVREYLNEGGKALWAGKHAGLPALDQPGAALRPDRRERAVQRAPAGHRSPALPRPVRIGSGDLQNDVLEYWFGGFLLNNGAGLTARATSSTSSASTRRSTRCTLMFNGADSAQNGDNANSFIATSGILPPDEFPQFESWVVGAVRPAGRAVRPAHRRRATCTPRSPTSPTSG